MAATRELSRQGDNLYTQAMSVENVALFMTGLDATNNGAAAPPMVQTVDFNDGQWCSTFKLSGTDNNINGEGVCKQIVAPTCAITADTTFTGVLDTTNYMMTYASSASFTANVWCNPASMTYDWTYQYEDQVVTDWSTQVEYLPALTANGTSSFGYSHHEADYQITNTFTVDYTPSLFTTQKPVSETATASFTHE
jgi:hypothetical protein